MGWTFLKILHEDCDPSLALDKSLPYTAYIIEYLVDDISHYDIAVGNKVSEMFDHYYDKHKKDFVTITQTEGRANPKLWGAQQATPPKKPKK